MFFAAPRVQDVITIKTVLDFFGQVSGLRTNIQKSQLAPICCSEEQISRIWDILPAQVATFPIQYLGLPLTVGRMKKSHFQPLIDKVASKIPSWKAQLMNKAGRLTVVKSVMSSVCTHTLLALDVPDWVLREIDKSRKGFLWAGKNKTHGGHCAISWPTACRPFRSGGLGIPDLKISSKALRLHWMWLKRTEVQRPWIQLSTEVDSDKNLRSIFQASIRVQLGDGNAALFWEDNWMGDSSPCFLAPDFVLWSNPK